MDQNAPSLGTELELSSMFDTTLRIGLVAVLVYACARIVLPLAFILPWSAILAVMLYPLHLCPGRLPWRALVGTAHRAGWRRGDVGADGHRGDVARDITLCTDLELAESRCDGATTTTMARRNTAGG